jgi:hypothetical protein
VAIAEVPGNFRERIRGVGAYVGDALLTRAYPDPAAVVENEIVAVRRGRDCDVTKVI